MKTNRIMGWVMVLAVAAGMSLPRPAEAGQKEWATAGKILTGAVIVSALHHAARAPASVYQPVHRHNTVVVHTPPAHHYQTVVVHTPPQSYGRWHGSHQPTYGRCPPPPPRPTYGRSRQELTPNGYNTPIIIQTEGFRRLYQPPIKGHPAFVQQWNRQTATWVTVGSHPSIW